ncbi:MAG: SRPBCC family protein [Acidimicrobiales bacterium]|nr:SRPBCC family protein [Acidimicrobiales bacterium]
MAEMSVSASAEVEAPAKAVFDFIRRPSNHPEISGDGSVRGVRSGPDVLSMGDRFGMSMKIGLPYIITNRVVEFEDGRLIAWCHPGRHRWRWQVEPLGDDRCRVTLTFDMSTALFPPVLRLLGFPERHRSNVEASVANVAKHFAH